MRAGPGHGRGPRVAASHQVIDVPLVTATVTQYDEYVVECACWRLHTAPLPAQAGVPGTVTYGLNIQAWCVFLLAARHVPVARCAEIIASLSGIRPSDGFVHAMLARAAAAVAAANMLIRALIITAAVICADETPIRVGPGPKACQVSVAGTKTGTVHITAQAHACASRTSSPDEHLNFGINLEGLDISRHLDTLFLPK